MKHPHDIAECIMDACHGFTFHDLGAESVETGPVATQNGETWFDLDVPPFGQFKVIVRPLDQEDN